MRDNANTVLLLLMTIIVIVSTSNTSIPPSIRIYLLFREIDRQSCRLYLSYLGPSVNLFPLITQAQLTIQFHRPVICLDNPVILPRLYFPIDKPIWKSRNGKSFRRWQNRVGRLLNKSGLMLREHLAFRAQSVGTPIYLRRGVSVNGKKKKSRTISWISKVEADGASLARPCRRVMDGQRYRLKGQRDFLYFFFPSKEHVVYTGDC